MLLYVHVPFCSAKCGYCAFHSEPATAEALALYLETLLQEIASWAERLSRPALETIYLGGGTPSLLKPHQVERIIHALARHFPLAEGLELTMEGNPESLRAKGYLPAVRRAGVNRLSMGVQSLSDEDLRVLGRRHSSSQAVSAFRRARAAGFANVSLDLIWGLPGQRLKTWLDQLKAVTALGPEHLSLYGLTVEPGTPLEEQCLTRQVALPADEEQAKMFVYGTEYLESQGYLHYEVSNYARMGFQSRHNLGYWEGEEYLGLGPSAVSCIAGRRWANPADLKEYAQRTRQGTLDQEAEDLDLACQVREMLMLRLRTSRGLRLRDFRRLTGLDFMHEYESLVQALHKNELVRLREGYMRLTTTGMLVSNTILENLFAHPVCGSEPPDKSLELQTP